MRERERAYVEVLTKDTIGSPYKCCKLFDLCSDQAVLSLSLEGAAPFLDWVGWEKSDVCLIKKSFINYVRPEYSGQSATAGYVSNPCSDPNGVDYGVCDFTLEDFARLRRQGPVRDVTENTMRYCWVQPRYRVDGTLIESEREWDLRFAGEVILQDLKRMLVEGNATTSGQFDGLERLVKTGYTSSNGNPCPLMDSIVIDWNSNGMSGGAGITWNGAAVGATYSLVDVLLAAYRQIRQRILWSPTLAAQPLMPGDIAIVLPNFLIQCLLDAYTCWSVCAGSQYNEVNKDSYEARVFRNGLIGGMFGFGKVFFDGFEIPLIGYDWGLVNGGAPITGDIYMLTGQIGNIKTLQGQFLDMSPVPGTYPGTLFGSTDGGRFLTWTEQDNTCVKELVEFRPRLLSWAPWANVRVQDVTCSQPGPVLSIDPTSNYFDGMSGTDGTSGSFYSASCP